MNCDLTYIERLSDRKQMFQVEILWVQLLSLTIKDLYFVRGGWLRTHSLQH